MVLSEGPTNSLSADYTGLAERERGYPLQDLEIGGGSGSSGEYVNVPRRESADSAPSQDGIEEDHRDDEHDAPLLPTTAPVRSETHWGSNSKGKRGCLGSIVGWFKGPDPPHKFKIEPFFPNFQIVPIRLVDSCLPSRALKIWGVLAFHVMWVLLFFSILHASVTSSAIPGYGVPARLSCTTRLWPNSKSCGLNGDFCRPFDNSSFAFRCSAGCKSTMVLEPYAVGAQEINYQSLVIGGTPGDQPSQGGIYRGDSFICAAAMHAGIIDDRKGGCGVLHRAGQQTDFGSVKKHGISSISFPSHFPLSFYFGRESSATKSAPKCTDERWPLFTISVISTCILSLFTTSPAVFYTSTFVIVWFQVALSSDPPFFQDYYEVVSLGLGRFLPAAFVGFAIYYFCVRHTLKDLTAQWEKTILWLSGCWVAALDNYTFDRLPISRLTPHDIKQQPGAIPVLIIIVAILVTAVITQALAFRKEGRLPRYLLLYGVMACGILAMVAVPQMNLRIHHYILGLLFLPGTAIQTRPSLLYQGLLVGLFINGVARWGFDSILQTPGALLADAQLGSILPNITAPVISYSAQEITFQFDNLAREADGISVIVNDVERFHGYKEADGGVESFTWTRQEQGLPEFFRFGYMKMNPLGGTLYQDFTKAGIWEANGSWVHMEPGPS
ncbi:hypothetical protein DTO166G4_29 [Paecilomyces variotii]|uniref:LCCL domain protein n=1 Tax=Byssochlamys spectabilis TaxID=264951 RepID=A0A443HW66_BYSSP|nr:LCCL domain protein [Paecilomyces variotii]KAJ9218163.1 hypothetical protein DTO166G4_29 [Paecilomyces variotii]KAJ9239870.1 hypothetical protein DTO166G5_2137 [Paecilomyces variotii]KAJ9244662.1 hypothetical protein DTO169E5_1483 [Paecilomyces variotii]KAJ9257101.1 hypothetical protein DTO207G8_2273 [Paecilomyces variotii]KAJ9288901.1 hypothetical protein DTO021C3_3426 [Paecilomyces variotii]